MIPTYQKWFSHKGKMTESLRILTWNANGLRARARELKSFLHIKIQGFNVYSMPHSSRGAHDGDSIVIKDNI